VGRAFDDLSVMTERFFVTQVLLRGAYRPRGFVIGWFSFRLANGPACGHDWIVFSLGKHRGSRRHAVNRALMNFFQRRSIDRICSGTLAARRRSVPSAVVPLVAAVRIWYVSTLLAQLPGASKLLFHSAVMEACGRKAPWGLTNFSTNSQERRHLCLTTAKPLRMS
jgi:hypothetical protein